MSITTSRIIFTFAFIGICATSQAQTIDSVAPERRFSQEEDLIKRRTRLKKTSRLFTIFTICLVGASVVADERDSHSSRYLVIGGLASASIALWTAIRANKVDKQIRQLHQR